MSGEKTRTDSFRDRKNGVSTIFPKWSNKLPTMLLGGVLCGLATVIGLVWYYFTPKFWSVGYMPVQPVSGFSHQIHAGKLGMDCRYCHSHVEESAEANIPPVATCMGCHADGHVAELYAKKENVKFVSDAWNADASIPWRRVHKVPDYVRNFPHHIHVNAGVSCYSCHGNIMEQPVVHQVQSLSMGWCLECHRNPEPHLVPKDKVTDLAWVRNQFESTGFLNTAQTGTGGLDASTPGGPALLKALEEKNLHLLPQNCGACHY